MKTNMHAVFAILALAACLTIPSAVLRAEQVAVLGVFPAERGAPFLQALRDSLIEKAPWMTGKLLMGQQKTQKGLNDSGIAPQRCFDNGCLLRAGRLLGADYIVAGSVYGKSGALVSLKVIDVKAKSVLFADSTSVTDEAGIPGAFSTLAGRIAPGASHPIGSAKAVPSGAGTAERNILESWYLRLGVGYAKIQYPSADQRAIDRIEDHNDVKRMSVSVDLPGAYLPFGTKLLAGADMSGFAERFTTDNETLQLNFYLYSASALYFFGPRIGEGLFVRLDAGPALGVSQSSKTDDYRRSDWGYGCLVGAGYAIPVSSGTRLLLNAGYSIMSIENKRYGAMHIGAGLLL